MAEASAPAKILIVEDEALIAREIQHRLTNMGWKVVGTSFGEDALELALETRPDLLLSDINLRRGLSGIDVAQQIQAQMDVPVVFLTAYSDEDTVSRAKAATPYGYIIKPVENRDLQITIDMALYKFRVERELKEQKQLLETALACIGNALIFLDEKGRILNANEDASALLGQPIEPGKPWDKTLQVADQVSTLVAAALNDDELVKLPPFILKQEDPLLVDGIVGPMEDGVVLILRDLGKIDNPIPLEPGEHYAMLGADHLSPSESSFCQLLVAPDAVEHVTPALIDKIREVIDKSLRATDLASVFGQNMVSVSMPYTPLSEGEKISRALLDALSSFTYRGKSFGFSAGLAFSVGGDQEPVALFRRATSALDTARRSGGGRLWVDGGDTEITALDIHGGQSYRHVVLLWNVMNALSNATDLASMSDEFCRHVFRTFQCNRTALLGSIDDRLVLEVGYTQQTGSTTHISDMHFSEREFAAIKAIRAGDLKEQILHHTFLFPIGDLRVLMLTGNEFDEEDRVFLETVCAYFTSAVARFDVSTRVVEEIEEPVPDLIYDSAEMQQVLDTADLAAPTDATVLLTGESGTGKEMVARYIHQHGDRQDQPLVVVDCGAVAPSLIESELFGHVKGAFTGATSNFKGRLKDAEGGTVLLDEIGELPLDTQVKLLRFVQDRQVAAVGSNKYETVDARVIAATNKDLKEMVADGTFREDLYYRLNVFTVAIPPLRDRRGDVLSLARHYLKLFAARYRKSIDGFTTDAEQSLLDYGWPGNVRELSNVINRAVIMSKDALISSIQLGLFVDTGEVSQPEVANPPVEGLGVVRTLVDLGSQGTTPLPIGRFLEEDFILMSVSRHDGVLNRAALAIGMPESTLRRRLQKISLEGSVSGPDRPEDWPISPSFYERVMEVSAAKGAPPLEALSGLLLKEVESRSFSRAYNASLMGVSLPTYRRMVSENANIFD